MMAIMVLQTEELNSPSGIDLFGIITVEAIMSHERSSVVFRIALLPNVTSGVTLIFIS
jgi:hypothetical protein